MGWIAVCEDNTGTGGSGGGTYHAQCAIPWTYIDSDSLTGSPDPNNPTTSSGYMSHDDFVSLWPYLLLTMVIGYTVKVVRQMFEQNASRY